MESRHLSYYYNDEFIEYYTYLFNKDEGVLDSIEIFMEYSRKPLPISFRFNESSPYSDLKQIILKKSPLELRDVGWLDNAYQIDVSKYDFKNDNRWSEFRNLLIEGDNSGVLNRQELVSMLPVLFLEIQRGDYILDICASPGMKYLQILDRLKDDFDGIVIGNDVSSSRLFTLAHRSSVLPVPSSCLTHSDGSRFTTLYDDNGRRLYFNKILVDVPCTCDGTLRKSLDIWKTWKTINSLHVHPMQYNIAKRAIDLLAPNGILVYSTCSLNPIENEAIISSLLSTGLVELVDCTLELKDSTLIYSRGLKDWDVYYQGEWYNSYDDVPLEYKKESGGRIMRSMFKQNWSDECASKVMRIFPHQNNSGGFFIAKLRRCEYVQSLKALSFEKRNLENPIETLTVDAGKVLHEYVPFQNFTPISTFYNISDDFPRHLVFIKRACIKSLYIFSEQLARICNGPYELKWASAGVKIFTRLDPKIADGWRFSQHGISLLCKYVNNRKFIITPKAAIYLLSDNDEYKDEYYNWYNNIKLPNEAGGLMLITPKGVVISAIINKGGNIFPYVPSPKFAIIQLIKHEVINAV